MLQIETFSKKEKEKKKIIQNLHGINIVLKYMPAQKKKKS